MRRLHTARLQAELRVVLLHRRGLRPHPRRRERAHLLRPRHRPHRRPVDAAAGSACHHRRRRGHAHLRGVGTGRELTSHLSNSRRADDVVGRRRRQSIRSGLAPHGGAAPPARAEPLARLRSVWGRSPDLQPGPQPRLRSESWGGPPGPAPLWKCGAGPQTCSRVPRPGSAPTRGADRQVRLRSGNVGQVPRPAAGSPDPAPLRHVGRTTRSGSALEMWGRSPDLQPGPQTRLRSESWGGPPGPAPSGNVGQVPRPAAGAPDPALPLRTRGARPPGPGSALEMWGRSPDLQPGPQTRLLSDTWGGPPSPAPFWKCGAGPQTCSRVPRPRLLSDTGADHQVRLRSGNVGQVPRPAAGSPDPAPLRHRGADHQVRLRSGNVGQVPRPAAGSPDPAPLRHVARTTGPAPLWKCGAGPQTCSRVPRPGSAPTRGADHQVRLRSGNVGQVPRPAAGSPDPAPLRHVGRTTRSGSALEMWGRSPDLQPGPQTRLRSDTWGGPPGPAPLWKCGAGPQTCSRVPRHPAPLWRTTTCAADHQVRLRSGNVGQVPRPAAGSPDPAPTTRPL